MHRMQRLPLIVVLPFVLASRHDADGHTVSPMPTTVPMLALTGPSVAISGHSYSLALTSRRRVAGKSPPLFRARVGPVAARSGPASFACRAGARSTDYPANHANSAGYGFACRQLTAVWTAMTVSATRIKGAVRRTRMHDSLSRLSPPRGCRTSDRDRVRGKAGGG